MKTDYKVQLTKNNNPEKMIIISAADEKKRSNVFKSFFVIVFFCDSNQPRSYEKTVSGIAISINYILFFRGLLFSLMDFLYSELSKPGSKSSRGDAKAEINFVCPNGIKICQTSTS